MKLDDEFLLKQAWIQVPIGAKKNIFKSMHAKAAPCGMGSGDEKHIFIIQFN